ncbi:MAG: hypothetical protein ACRDH5_06120 [bacterium]
MTATSDARSRGLLPTAPQLEQAPQLAILVVLDSTLEVTTCALQVAHPEIADDPECPYWVAPADRLIAEKLLALIDRLRTAIARYREALPEEPPAEHLPDNPYDDDPCRPTDSDDDIPF